MKTLEALERILKGKRIAEGTKKEYRTVFESLAKYSEEYPSEGYVINEWLNSLEGIQDTTVQKYYKLMNAGGRYIEKTMGRNEIGLPKFPNPCRDAERPKTKKKQRRYFSKEEIMKALKGCRNRKEVLLISVLIDSACRIGELVEFKRKDIGNGFILLKGKTGERKYRLSNRICEELYYSVENDDDLIFKNENGWAHNRGTMSQWVTRIVKRSGITGNKLGAHSFRHASASLVAEKTGSVLAVKSLLQHDEQQTSMQYIHDVEDKMRMGISPLELVGVDLFGEEIKQIETNNKQIEFDQEVPEDMKDIIIVETVDKPILEELDIFPKIKEGIKVRPLLKSEDLKIIKSMIKYYLNYNKDEDGYKALELLKRMLRKT